MALLSHRHVHEWFQQCFFSALRFFPVGVAVSLRMAHGPEPHDEPPKSNERNRSPPCKVLQTFGKRKPDRQAKVLQLPNRLHLESKGLINGIQPYGQRNLRAAKGKTRGPKSLKMLDVIVLPYGSQKGNAELG